MNSHELHREIEHWTTLQTHWDERICHLCDSKRVEDEKHFLLDSLSILKLDPNLKIFVTIQTFLSSEVMKTMVILEHFSQCFLNTKIQCESSIVDLDISSSLQAGYTKNL
jgi:hypothetical protein